MNVKISLFIYFAMLAFSADQASAHGTGWQQEEAFTVKLSFFYDDGTPMSYSEFQLYSPVDKDIPHQKGRTDSNGFFSFRPDCPGQWTFSIDDSQGHFNTGEIQISVDQLKVVDDGAGSNVLAKGGSQKEDSILKELLLGLSLILNLAFLLKWKLSRQKTAT